MNGKIFNSQEVQAMLVGNKTQFREVIKPQPDCHSQYVAARIVGERPYQVGQKIFVKESFCILSMDEHCQDVFSNKSSIVYKSEFTNILELNDLYRWKPAQHMKQEHSRLILQIKEIRVERLAEISADDCWKEGIYYSLECCENYIAVPDCNGNQTPSCCNNPNVEHPQPEFEQVWNTSHKKPEEKFEANPWVWSIQFEVVK